MKTKGVLVAIILVVGPISSTAGCIIGQSKMKAFVDAFHEGMKNDNGSTLKTWRETEIDKDTIRVMFTKENATSSIYYDLTVKCFQAATDATKFVDSINQGYILTNSADSSSFGSSSFYSSITGHSPTRADTYIRLDSIIPPKVSMIFQVDEFVMYGPGTSTTLEPIATPTPTPAQSIFKGVVQNSKIIIDAKYQGIYYDSNQFEQPKPGYKYVKFYVSVMNIGYPNKQIADLYFFKLFDSKNEGHSPAAPSFGEGGLKDIMNSYPGEQSAGTLIFEIKQNAEPVKLIYNDYDNDLTINL